MSSTKFESSLRMCGYVEGQCTCNVRTSWGEMAVVLRSNAIVAVQYRSEEQLAEFTGRLGDNLLCSLELDSEFSVAAPRTELVYSRLAVRSWLTRNRRQSLPQQK